MQFPNEPAAHRAARDHLLEQELALRRAMEAVAVARRALPPGGLVPQDYRFQGRLADGSIGDVRLSEQFTVGDTLVVYNFMFPRSPRDDRPGPVVGATARLPLQEGPCPSCTALLDQLDSSVRHLAHRLDVVVVAKTSPRSPCHVCRRAGLASPALAVDCGQPVRSRLRSRSDVERVSPLGGRHPSLLEFRVALCADGLGPGDAARWHARTDVELARFHAGRPRYGRGAVAIRMLRIEVRRRPWPGAYHRQRRTR